jgi:hypothetical protein
MAMSSAKLLALIGCLSVAGLTFVGEAAKADQNRLLACIKQFTGVGVSPDAALTECNKKSLATCVQELIGKKYEATAIKYIEPNTVKVGAESQGGYLIDLGNIESRWLEGKQWREKGCAAFTKGPYKRQSDRLETFWNTQRSYEWFRQGICRESKIQLDQPYSMEEAKLHCELGNIQPARITAPGNSEQPTQ